MALNDIKFQKTNGGMARTAAGEDFISGLIISAQDALTNSGPVAALLTGKGFDVTGDGANTLYVAKLGFADQLGSQYGIATDKVVAPPWEIGAEERRQTFNAIDYHVREFFRMSPTGTLYLAIRPSNEVADADIKRLQYYSAGKLRQVGVLTKTLGGLTSYQTAATALEAEHQPLSVIVGYTGFGSYNTTPATLAGLTGSASHIAPGRSNVSVVISCDLLPETVEALGGFAYFGAVGNALGAVSNAAVNESIAWVQKFPVGLELPGFITGDLLRDVNVGQLDSMNDNRYIFVRTHEGAAGNYYNDSFTLDVATSDYAFIENVRTMDKATRGIRANLLPHLGSPLYVDAETGRLRADTVAFLETTAGRALEDMEKAGELSGYSAVIDPEQNVLATSQVEVLVKNVAVGVMRKVLVKIGYTTSLG